MKVFLNHKAINSFLWGLYMLNAILNIYLSIFHSPPSKHSDYLDSILFWGTWGTLRKSPRQIPWMLGVQERKGRSRPLTPFLLVLLHPYNNPITSCFSPLLSPSLYSITGPLRWMICGRKSWEMHSHQQSLSSLSPPHSALPTTTYRQGFLPCSNP